MEEAPASMPTASWADIPVELAGLVLDRLPAHTDRVLFAAVCPQWRAAAQQGPPPMPMLLLPDGTVYSLPGSEPFQFPGCAGYKYSCGTGNWLVFSGKDGCFLRDPFSKDTVTLPALTRARMWDVGDESDDEAGHVWVEMNEQEVLAANKILFCSPHLIAAIFSFMCDGSSRIAVCQPGGTSWWSVHMDHQAALFADIVFHQGKLYALDFKNMLFAVDITVDHSTGNPWIPQIQQVISGLFTGSFIIVPGILILNLTYLVESRGALLLVYRKIYLGLKAVHLDRIEVLEAERNRFEVYEADFGQSRWTKVSTLGDDQVLFLCRRCSRSVSISHNKMPGDRIFFMENEEEYHHCYSSKDPSSSCSVYDMRDGKVCTPLPMVSWKPGTVLATWLLP
ncbi:unnamed protein product [Urochloa decumbens]|uniref:KIB1-4 beta-propeller domain-containing protein n=1 Tax=Urochloa decumbens TaxID=240449 RepID=A0ABC9B2U4_9POAL